MIIYEAYDTVRFSIKILNSNLLSKLQFLCLLRARLYEPGQALFRLRGMFFIPRLHENNLPGRFKARMRRSLYCESQTGL